MIYTEDLEQMARIISDTEYKGIRIFSASIYMPFDEWHHFEDGLHRCFPPRDLLFVKEHRSIYSGALDRQHYEVSFGSVKIKCYRERPIEFEPKYLPRETDRY